MKSLIEATEKLLADVVTFYFMSIGFHWNVEGQDFSQYHSLFQMIYEDVSDSVDGVAENIRKLDAYAPFDLSEYVKMTSLKVKDVDPSPKAMASALKEANDKVIETYMNVFKEAEKQDEQGFMDFLAGRIDMHKKWAWMLRASTK